MGLRKEIFKGLSWMAGLRIVNRFLGIVRIGVLARVLSPSQFGVFAVGTLVLGFLEIATGTGVNVFLIQEKGKFEKYLSSAWVVSILRGILMALVIFLASPFLASFFGAPQAREILVLISIVPLIRGFINPSVVKFQKDLEFNKEFYKETFLFLVETVAAITLGVIIESENAFVYAMMISSLCEVVLSFTFIKPKPTIKIDFSQVKEIVDRGKWVTGASIFDYLFHHLDDMVVGRVLGTASLGLYQQAYKVSSLPVSETAEVFNKVTFPVYTNIAEDKARLKQAYLSTTLIILLLAVPFGILIMLFSREVILITLGDKWLEAEKVLRVLAVYGVLKAISNSTYSLFLALKKQEMVTVTTFVTILGLSISIIPLVHQFGLVGAAYSTIIGTLVGIPFSLYYLSKVFK